MTTSNPESSSPMPTAAPAPDDEAPDAAAPDSEVPEGPPLMTDAEKLAFVTSKASDKAVRKVAAGRGVLDGDWDDIIQKTRVGAMAARLPADPLQAAKIRNRIAFCVSCRHMGVDPAGEKETYVEEGTDDQPATRVEVQQSDPVTRKAIGELLEVTRARFPKGADDFFQAKVQGETSAQVAARRGVSASAIRKEWGSIGDFMEKEGRARGLISLAALLILVATGVPFVRWVHAPGDPYRHSQGWSEQASIQRHVPVLANDPVALRKRAAIACQDAAWDACLTDLEAAYALDHKVDTVDEAQWRLEAEVETRRAPGRPSSTMDMVKPPLR